MANSNAPQVTGSESKAAQLSRYTWRDGKAIVLRVIARTGQNNIPVIAAGIAFYALLALFPGITALVSVYGLIADPQGISAFLESIGSLLPAEAFLIIENQTARLVDTANTSLGLASGLAFLLSLWSAKNGVKAMMKGLNAVYYEQESRSFFKGLAVATLLTLVLILIAALVLVAIVIIPIIIGFLPLGPLSEWIISFIRWPILFVAVVFGIGLLYRYGPHHKAAKQRWITSGAVLAASLWLAASIGFSYYVANFSSYNEIYGSLGAIIILLMWFWLSAFIVLLGAELNAAMDHHTPPGA